MVSFPTIWTYLWNVVNKGIDEDVTGLQGIGLDSISIATAYHTYHQLHPRESGPQMIIASEAAPSGRSS